MTPSPFTHEEFLSTKPPLPPRQGSNGRLSSADIPGTQDLEESSGGRRQSLRKVLATVSGQILFNALLIAIFVFKETARVFLRENDYIFDTFKSGTFYKPSLSSNLDSALQLTPNTYTMAILYTVTFSCFVACLSGIFKTSSILFGAGTTTGIFILLLIKCPPTPKINVAKCWIFQFVAIGGLVIARMIVWYLNSNGSLASDEYPRVMPSLILSFFLILLLDDYYNVLGISWFEDPNDAETSQDRIYQSLSIYFDLMCVFFFLLFLFEPEILGGATPTCPLQIE